MEALMQYTKWKDTQLNWETKREKRSFSRKSNRRAERLPQKHIETSRRGRRPVVRDYAVSGILAFPRHEAGRIQNAFSSNDMRMWRIRSTHHRRMHGVQTEHLPRILPIKKISLRRVRGQKFNKLQISTKWFFRENTGKRKHNLLQN
jgi:hypothetical protein